MAERMTLDELKSYLWQSAVLLRTNIDAGAYKQYIFPLMFFKRICDVYRRQRKRSRNTEKTLISIPSRSCTDSSSPKVITGTMSAR